eukprot:CAMPEP_0198434300 /NCGR_PEP_ID=MMETSP1452-20131203/31850_1 /TAXON_ID=1181717 /ORGANISM="Synchroma pusillum, Strain CCMP3072" /LENGTH=589 /DNA_ID=CAMNT_0044154809 /DNA_START=1 /DNA_END=1770 /DNA_ORIENTATION=-
MQGLGDKRGLYHHVPHTSMSVLHTTAQQNRRAELHGDSTPSAAMPRSNSAGPGGLREARERARRDLYGSLPFIGVFGFQHTERRTMRVMSRKSLQSLSEAESEKAELLDVDVDEIIVTSPLVFAVFVAVLSMFLVGFNTGVMNAPEPVVFPGHTDLEWAVAVSCFAIGGPFGALAGGLLANIRGRRGALLICSWIFLLGGLLLSLAPSVLWLVPARLLTGFASGYASVLCPIYLGEIAPPTLRGTLGTCTQFAMVIGILASSVLAFPLATEKRWRFLFAVTPALAALQLLCSPLLLESPRWLLRQETQESGVLARRCLKQLRGFRSDEEVEQEVAHLEHASAKHRTRHTSAHSGGAMWDLLTDRTQRVLTVSAIVLQLAQQLCGINAVFYYSTTFFTGIIDNPLQGTTLVATVNVLATYVALRLMDNTGRRTLLLTSAGGMLVSTIFIIAALLGVVPRLIALVATMAFVSFFEIGLGPVPWLVVAEMFPAKSVATAMSIASQTNWAANFMVGLCFPFMNSSLGAWSFGPFAVVLVLAFAFVYLYLPETHGRSVAEVQRIVQMEDEFANAIHVIEAVEGYSGYSSVDQAL